MKLNVLWYLISLIGLCHANYLMALQKRFKRTDETSTQLGLGSKDKETLQEALEILNMGKHSLNLPTEDTQLLMQLADVSSDDTDKSDQIEKFVEGPSEDHFSSNGKQYLALSGDKGQVHVDNFSIVTPGPEEASTNKNAEVQDVFKMVVRKKVPGSKDNAVHKISIVETNRMEPFARMEYPQSKRRRRKGIWPLIDSSAVHRVRNKRAKDDPLLRFIRGDFSRNDINQIFGDKGTSGRRTIRLRFFSENDKLHGNNRNSKRKFDDRGNKGHAGNEFHETAPWMKSQFRLEPPLEKDFRADIFHPKRDTNKHKKFHTPFNNLQSRNWHPLKLKSQMDDEFVDDVLKIINDGKTAGIDKALSNEGLSHYFSTTKSHILPRSGTTRAYIPEHSSVKKNVSPASSEPDRSSETYTTESGTTLQRGKIDQIPVVALDKYSFEKSIISPSEDNIKETKSASIADVAIVVFIGLLCFATVFLFFSIAMRYHTQKPCCSTFELKGAQVTVNIHDDSFPDNLNGKHHQLPYKSHSGLYYRKMTTVQQDEEKGDFDLPDFEWQSEMGEWLSDQGSVRHAIAFEEL